MLTAPQQGTPAPPARQPLSRWYFRVPLKWVLFLAITIVVLFPYPSRLARHIAHVRNLELMVQPDAPEFDAWDAELSQRLAQETGSRAPATQPLREWLRTVPPREVQKKVEAFVYEKVKYAWDWDTWGVADYMPTVAEVFAASAGGPLHEDCDGRAVIAASLMRRLGYDSSIVTDLRHVWVATPQGEWMGPGCDKTVISTPRGNRLAPRTAVSNSIVSLSFGIAVFPWWREMLILMTAYVLSLHRRISRGAAALGGLLLLEGLLFMRCGVLAPRSVSGYAASWPAWVGLLHWTAAFVILWSAAHRARCSLLSLQLPTSARQPGRP